MAGGLQVDRFGGPAVQQAVLGIYSPGAMIAITAISTKTIATITGYVALRAIFGVVTTIVQAQANAAKLVATPTAGTANDICATLDINAAEVGAVLSITGLISDAMQGAVNKSGGLGMQTRDVVLSPGTLGLNTAASSTGAIQWYFYWVPLTASSKLVAS